MQDLVNCISFDFDMKYFSVLKLNFAFLIHLFERVLV